MFTLEISVTLVQDIPQLIYPNRVCKNAGIRPFVAKFILFATQRRDFYQESEKLLEE